jgi:ATP-dependent DNA ligase I
VRLAELVTTSEIVTATSSRRAKTGAIAGLLRRTEPTEVPIAVAFLSGELRQRQIGVGYAALRDIAAGLGEPLPSGGPPAGRRGPGEGGETAGAAPPLTLTDVDMSFAQIGAAAGAGSQAERRRLLAALFSRASGQERSFLVRLLSGDLRQGALEGVMVEAIANAADVPPEEVRRAHMLGGSLLAVASAALAPVEHATALAALRSFTLKVGRPLQPMLASSADSVGAALERVRPAAVEWKIDGIRVQVHKDGSDVLVFTRTLDDITSRVPEVVAAAVALPAKCAVLDGEIIALGPDGRPLPFQVTASRTGNRSDVARLAAQVPLTSFFFDLLHLDGADLVDAPGAQRYARLAEAVAGDLLIPRIVTAQDAEAAAFFDGAVAHGHEGVLVKSLDSPYAAGRRGLGWIKVKPRHTLDLVVIAAEWGHGRRRGWLSNLHLAAHDPDTGGYVMLGKTFKGLTDEILTWQTSRLLELADPPRSRSAESAGAAGAAAYGVVRVRPELVVEIAFDGVQASPRYPGGLALRFARVLRYRPDKRPADADTIGAVREIAARAGVSPA